MSLADVMADAITLAERGFPMHHFMASNLKEDAEQMRRWDSWAAIFLPGGRPPEPGEVFVQKDLARTMRRFVAAEARRRNRGREAGLQAARDLFYRGEIAREIAAFYQSQGGLLTYDDLASCQRDDRGTGARPLSRVRRLHVRSVVSGTGARPGPVAPGGL